MVGISRVRGLRSLSVIRGTEPTELQSATIPEALVDAFGVYRSLRRIRVFEERAAELFEAGEIKGTAHSCIGQEAIAVGVARALGEHDHIAGHHRSHGHLIARGADPVRMMGELFGLENGYCRGLGGSMHIADLALGVLGCNGIVGASTGLAAGSALSASLTDSDRVAVAFFGDGAAGQGLTHEVFNLATVWRLPVIFVCENNQFALSIGWQESRVVEDIAARAPGYAMPFSVVDGNDVWAVESAVADARQRALQGDGPTLIEAKTYRILQHSFRANLPDNRSETQEREWLLRDPLLNAQRRVTALGANTAMLDHIDMEVAAEIDAAAVSARTSGALSPSDLVDSLVYAPRRTPLPPAPEATTAAMTYVEAIRSAMHQEMTIDDSVILIGEDVAEIGGIFQATAGLVEAFGPARVRNTPISEAGFVTTAVGAALTGSRPIVEIQIFDFVTLAMDAIVNQAAKLRFMMGGDVTVPIVVRGPSGGGAKLAAQHSQSLEAWFAHIPGLTVVAPATPYDAKGLLAAAIRDDNPVIFLETKSLMFGQAEQVPVDPYTIEIGKANVVLEGSDVTLVATQGQVPNAVKAASDLARTSGISVEVIDPRTIFPLDTATILDSVRKTSRLIVAHEAVSFCGIGAEIVAQVADEAFWYLDAPIRRVTAPHHPVPYAARLEAATIPTWRQLADATRQLVEE